MFPFLQARQWECRACGTGRDAAAVEPLLLREVAAQVRAYQLQDLKCHKCRQVRRCEVAHNKLENICQYESQLRAADVITECAQDCKRAAIPRPLLTRAACFGVGCRHLCTNAAETAIGRTLSA